MEYQKPQSNNVNTLQRVKISVNKSAFKKGAVKESLLFLFAIEPSQVIDLARLQGFDVKTAEDVAALSQEPDFRFSPFRGITVYKSNMLKAAKEGLIDVK